MSPSLATSQHCPAAPAGGKHHAAPRGGPRSELQGSLPAGRHQGWTCWRRGEKREHSRWLHRGEGVSGGKREKPTVRWRGRQQRSWSQTDSWEDWGHGELHPPHSSGCSMQGSPLHCVNCTMPVFPSLHSMLWHFLLLYKNWKQDRIQRQHHSTRMTHHLKPTPHLFSFFNISKAWQYQSGCLVEWEQQITESWWLKVQPG